MRLESTARILHKILRKVDPIRFALYIVYIYRISSLSLFHTKREQTKTKSKTIAIAIAMLLLVCRHKLSAEN